MEHEREFDQLVERLSDYDELLRYGQIIRHDVDEPEGWRREMRAKARADRIRLRTGQWDSAPRGVWAVRIRSGSSFEMLKTAFELIALRKEAASRALLYGHDELVWLRMHETRGAARCASCGRRVYIDTSATPVVMEGEAFEEECSTA